MLLSFEIELKDDAYIIERAHFERELYREFKGLGKSTKKTRNEAIMKYWESRVPALDYRGVYELPQFAIFSPVEFERLSVEWRKPHDEVWKRVLDNNW